MELRHLRYFVAVAEEQNITRAALRLHVSQPPLSRQMKDLEHELGVSLFTRTTRSVRLTAAGTVFLDEARAVLARAEQAARTVRSAAEVPTAELRLGYAPSLAVELLPRALREFERNQPRTRVSLHDLSTEEMLRALHDGTLDLSLMIRPHARALPGLVFHELRRYALCVALPAGHPLSRGRVPPLARIWSERLVAYTRTGYPEYHAWLMQLSGGQVQIAEEHDSSTSLIAAVEAGRGVALVPESFACFAGPRLKLRKFQEQGTPFRVGLCLPKSGRNSITQAFLAAARTASA